jgi:hypothetical protein
MPLIHTPKDSEMYFHATKPLSYDVISTVLDTNLLAKDVTLGTKNYELQAAVNDILAPKPWFAPHVLLTRKILVRKYSISQYTRESQ